MSGEKQFLNYLEENAQGKKKIKTFHIYFPDYKKNHLVTANAKTKTQSSYFFLIYIAVVKQKYILCQKIVKA